MSQTKTQLFDDSNFGPQRLINGAHNAFLDANGDLNLNGRNLVLVNQAGIDFSATGGGDGTPTTELFSDYEEGTWAGTLGQGGTGFNFLNSKYIKCGRLCWVTARITGLTNPTAGGIRIDNLPYASYVSPTWEATGTCMMDSVNYTTTPVQVTPYISNATNIFFYMTFDNGSWAQMTGNEMTTSGSIIFSVVYPTLA